MLQKYKDIRFKPASLDMIDTINEIVNDYEMDGLVLTVRQLYYQLVARGIIANHIKSYKNIVGLVNNGKLAGYIDWDMFEDRTRAFKSVPMWNGIGHFFRSVGPQYEEDPWTNQDCRVYCIVEKEALFGVMQRVCDRNAIPLLAARGYPSSTVVRNFCIEHLLENEAREQHSYILHFGDHDPSGIDMTRDLEDRIALFCEGEASVQLFRMALNRDQVEELNPPENPAKLTDPRASDYIRKHGRVSWELDAIEPRQLEGIVQRQVESLRDETLWEERQEEIRQNKARILEITQEYS